MLKEMTVNYHANMSHALYNQTTSYVCDEIHVVTSMFVMKYTWWHFASLRKGFTAVKTKIVLIWPQYSSRRACNRKHLKDITCKFSWEHIPWELLWNMYHLRKTVLLSQSEVQKHFFVPHFVRKCWFPETSSINYVIKFHGMSWSNRCFLFEPLVCCFSYVESAILPSDIIDLKMKKYECQHRSHREISQFHTGKY